MSYGDYPDLSGVKKILVVKMRHHGDVLLASPVFSLLKQRLPNAQIDAFIYEETLPMLEGHPAIAECILYLQSWRKLKGIRKWAQEVAIWRFIRRRSYEVVINLTEGDRGALMAWVSGSRIRVGFDAQKKGFWGKNRVYTHNVKQCPHPRHTVERQLDVLRRMGIFPTQEERALLLHIPHEAHRTVQQRLIQEGISEYIVIHAVSRWRFKCLSIQQMGALIRALYQLGEKMILTASPDPEEMAMVEEIVREVPEIPVLNWAGTTSLKELAALIQGASVLVTVDSVPLHIASALKTPVVVFFGPTSEVNWGPWQHSQARVVVQGHSCRPCYRDGCGGSKKSDCLLTLSVGQMLEAFYSLKSCPKYEARASLFFSNSSTVPAINTLPS